MRPFSEVPEIEIQVICLGQRIEVGEIKIEDISGLERPKGCHIEKSGPLVTVVVGMVLGMPKECLRSQSLGLSL